MRLLDELDAFDADTYIPSHQRPWTKEEFRQERDKLRMMAKFTDLCGGDKLKITKEYQNYVDRTLKEDEIETIAYFENQMKRHLKERRRNLNACKDNTVNRTRGRRKTESC